MKTLNNARISPPPGQRQSGYIMILVTLFLMILMAGSAQLFSRIADDTITSGTLRDSTESLMLAETAMERLRGQYINTLDSVTEAPTNQLDKNAAAQLTVNMDDPDATLFAYMYYVTDGAGLDQSQPALLQKVANGEAAGAAASSISTRGLDVDTTQIRINDLFASVDGSAVAPMLYTLNDNGLLTSSTAGDWDEEVNEEKAAAWIEVTQNPTNGNAVDLFVQAMAQVGTAKSYVQRYIGSYSNTMGSVSALAEASDISR